MGKPTPGRPPVLPAGGSISRAATVHTSPCEGLLPECLKGPRPTPRPLGQDRELHRGAAQGRAMAPLVCHGLPPAPAGPRPGDVGTGPWLSLRAWFLPRGFGEHRAVPECSWSRLRRKLALSFSLELCPNSSLFQSRPPQRHLAPGNGNRRGRDGQPAGGGERPCMPAWCPDGTQHPIPLLLWAPRALGGPQLSSQITGMWVGRAQIRLSGTRTITLLRKEGKRE